MIRIYHNPRCTKSRQSLEVLEKSGEKFEVVKYLDDTPTVDELKEVLGYLNIPAENLIRKNEAIWKENFRNKTMSEDQLLAAMVEYPKLIERPIVIKGNKAVIGRPTEKVYGLLKK